MCDCVEQSQFTLWYAADCAAANNSTTSNKTATSNLSNSSSSFANLESNMFENVSALSILLGITTGFAMLALIALSVLFARYRKRQHTVVALQDGIMKVKSLHQKSMKFNVQLKVALQKAQREVDAAVGKSNELLKPYLLKHAELVFEEEIGHGSFGVVWRGRFKGDAVAIKTVRMTKITQATVREFMAEIEVMAPLKHPHLVRLIGGCWSDGPDKLCVVLEFCGRGSLKDLLADQGSGHCWAHPYFAITHGVALCFRYLHHEQPSGDPLLHRDLKSDNVMICDDLSPRVGDLGESKRFNVEEAAQRILLEGEVSDFEVLTMTSVGTPAYAAPEIILHQAYGR